MSAVYISLPCLLHLYAVSQTVGLAVLDEACASQHEMKMKPDIHRTPVYRETFYSLLLITSYPV